MKRILTASNPFSRFGAKVPKRLYRIHGTHAPEAIGTHVSPGCIRPTNQDVADLYSRVNVGTKVIVLPMDRRAEHITGKRS